ncbi:polymorphic toxin-type HINT domain-containing protein [Streptomyces sp. NBC_00047]|uniref:ricin-type beta-trefoil lectin domain protein n=1 Tax=Streptomyces sp. NBC_00047 TaxID=2975627 RepID=UPI0022595D9D|nr:ricin-type beta-trefoil lectin domain protein [Streptomyces sp. NBC_00047]MCX5613492.1 polymorphic toxin-type HINT domain-containing protein [Streptomyces sp. NBC_00047]
MLTATLLPVQAWAAPPGDRTGVTLPDLQEDRKAERDQVASAQLEGWFGDPPAPLAPYAPTAVAVPAGGSDTVPLTAGVEFTQVGTLPVSIGKLENTGTAPSGTWSAAVSDRAKTEAAGVDGAMIKITPPADAVNPVDVALDYSKFEDLYGTEWSSRLKLRQFPACFLDTPDLPECSVSTDVPSVNDPSKKRVVATVNPAAAPVQGMHTMTAGAGETVLVASDGAAGAGGTYKATSLSASGNWTAGGSGGGFSWTYPLSVPPAPAGPTPSIAFSYSSQAVDGKTSVTNGQASWVGDGWDYNPGFIERRYRTCSDDLKATATGKPNNDNETDKKKGDLCWAGDNVVLSLGGSTTELVRDAASGKWVPASDDGSRVELKTGSGSGAKDGEYWVVTTRDGVRYHYGRHSVGTHGDGTSPQTVTDSVFTVPVFGNHVGEPCHAAAYADSSCRQAWRWNLDYVEDIHGNAMVIDWKKEENRYAKNEKYTEKDAAKVGYTRGGYPVRILYGLRASNLAGAPAGRVEFGVQQRCFPDKDTNCDDSQFGSKNALGWWDTPSPLHCKMDAASCDISSPTFWSRMRLDTVTTHGQRTEGSTNLTKVDQWALKQKLPKHRTDTSPPLWLESITRTGYSSSNSEIGVVLPAVSFKANAVDMPNRVVKPKDPVSGKPDAAPDFDRLRIETIRTETGGDIHVTYSAPCALGTTVPDQAKNTSRCFPVRWSPDPDLAPEKTPTEVFNKYVVESVAEKDRVAQRPDVVTAYTYEGGAAWAKEDDELGKPELRTYSQWRGYGSVLTTTGATENLGTSTATEQSQTRTRYFRGLSTPAAKVSVKDSTGSVDLGEDKARYQGQTAETITYTKAGGSVDVENRHLTWPWDSVTPTASRARIDDANGKVEAYRSGIDHTEEIQAVSGGKSRMVRTVYAYDSAYGLPKTTHTEVKENNGTGWATVKQSCSKPTYVHNTASNLIGLPAEVRETTGDCTDAGIAAGTVLSAARTSYDAANAFGAAPTRGLPYQVDSLDAAGTGWITSGRSEYDALGRAVKTYDALGNPSTTAFSPATGPAFTITATNALGHTVSTKVDPARGSVLEATDANGRKVTTAYDELGRSTKVWTPSQKLTDKPAYTFDYQIDEEKTPAVTTRALKDDGTYSTSIAIYDGLLRPRQTQTEGPGGALLVTDTLYSANGTVAQTNNGYLADDHIKTELFVPKSVTEVHNSTRTAYDGLGRAVRTTTVEKGTDKQSTITQYGGDWTLTRSAMSPTGATPLPGSRAVKTTTDALNRTTLVEHYTSTAAGDVNPSLVDNPATTKTRYEYDVRGKLAKVTDPANNNWTYAYDARGRMTSSTDPDMGTSTFTYNNLDQQTSTTNVYGYAQHTKYDVLGRKTELRNDNPTNGWLVASWTYDTLPGAKGQPVSATRNWGAGSYVSEVTGYDSEYRPTGSKITIPDLPATTGLAGTYAYSTTYTPTGKVQSTTLPATVGGLSAEKLITRYNSDGMVQTMSGLTWYTADTIYSPFGEVIRTATGTAPHRVWTNNIHDPHTGRVTTAESHRETRDPYSTSTLLSSLTYTYDTVGNPTSITDAQPDTRPTATKDSPLLVDRQCYTYDNIGQLTRAWTGKSAGCPSGPGGPARSEVGSAMAGDAYWQEYEFDAIGNRTKLTERDPTDATLDDVTDYAYGVDIGGPQPSLKKQPHALTKVNKTTKTAGSTVDSLSTYTYDQAGNTKTRTIDGDTQTLNWDRRNTLQSATSPGIGSVAVTGLAGKCLDVQDGQTADSTPVQLLTCNETKPQQWRINGDSVQALGKCLTAEGGKARLKTCDPNSAGQKFTYNATHKSLVTGTNQCLTVPNDNPAEGNDLDLYTCASPSPTPAQQWSFGNLTSYLYDASGNRVIQETGSSRTLYLGESEVTVNKAGQAIDAVRYYSSPGAPTTIRRTNGKTTGHTLSQQLSDHHNTASISVEQKDGQAVTRRKTDPYGNPRGTQPSNWPGTRTFLGVGTDDNTTGLTHIGAREYEPQTGRFISVDPVIDITDPLQMNGYTYANGNPVSNWDPSGLKTEECGSLYNCNGNTVITASNADKITYAEPWSQIRYYQTHVPQRDYRARGKGGRGFDEAWTHTRILKQVFINQQVPWKSGFDFRPGHFLAGMGQGIADLTSLTPFSGVTAGLGVTSAGDAYRGIMTQAGLDTSHPSYQVGEVLAPVPGGGVVKGIQKGATKLFGKCLNSFTPETRVLMADGTTKPIAELQPDDDVVATDPETGETSAKPVTATIYTEDDKKYVDLSIQTDDGVKTITTTDHHPFWSESDQAWKDAEDLTPGTTLRTDTGATAAIVHTRTYQAVNETYNLTVADLHTYYVLAGATPVLVHNTGGCDPLLTYANKHRNDVGTKFVSEYTSPSGALYKGRNRHGITPSGPLANALSDAGHHGGCAEVHCLIKAQAAEGNAGIQGGSMRTLISKNNSMPTSNTTGHGDKATPCGRCKRVLDSLGIGY